MSNFNKEETLERKRTETEAFKINEELMEMLHDESSGCYVPWQFANYKVHADTLKTTYDEVILWGKQEAMIRPGWQVKGKGVIIPNIFAKVSGVHRDVKLYREQVSALVKEENTLFFKKFPLYKQRLPKDVNKIYSKMLKKNGEIDKGKLLTSEYWKYKRLNSALQESIADKIIEFCKISSFWKYKTYKVKLRFSLINRIIEFFYSLIYKESKDEDMMKISIFAILTNLDEELLDLLQNFDYPLKVPKIIIYNNNERKSLTFADAVTLMFMNSMGVDIIIFNPGGTSDIENYVKEDFYDTHRLEEIHPNLPYRRNIIYRLARK
ncbi:MULTISPECIES: YceG family protein [Clostridium]|uniref:Putative component of 'biosynthetic module' domain-containing protein n=2 Tax=Clostridium TaxID=1485 RepID=A0A151AKQ1_9CLOT|nr:MULTISPECIES: YceG family protein [Clostridium]KYH28239.1 hypothetical protein CLCOL_21920 [Clostridium colicanis DSM 13634]MBE6044316.1 hypothetical protein [Clostridium thermopalmarium]PRR76553.1 hypothetical protein CPAL_02240 [Clostridium thermopalmarium DSM 5974]PVZ28334.1 YceG-like Ter operon protein [Clostridium thermopalmarium DSM 5974]